MSYVYAPPRIYAMPRGTGVSKIVKVLDFVDILRGIGDAG